MILGVELQRNSPGTSGWKSGSWSKFTQRDLLPEFTVMPRGEALAV